MYCNKQTLVGTSTKSDYLIFQFDEPTYEPKIRGDLTNSANLP